MSWRVVQAWAQDYAAAYELFDRDEPEWPAPVNEVVLAKPCDSCRLDPATAEQVDAPAEADRVWQVCADCAVRYRAAGATRARTAALVPRAQQRLADRLPKHGVTAAAFPRDFQELAEAGHHEGGGAATQIALVYADGNRVGAFLRAAAQRARTDGRPGKEEIVTAIDAACVGAVARATAAVTAPDGRPPVISHVAGGDDVLVSVSAAVAWPFVVALLTGFDTELAAATKEWQPALRRQRPTMSAGLVFHHYSAPFPDMRRLAAQALQSAKGTDAGGAAQPAHRDPAGSPAGAAVAFVDLTVDGSARPQGRAHTVEQLESQRRRLGRVAALPAAQRATLLSLLRIAEWQEQGRDTERERRESAAAAVARRVVDSGATVLWRIACDTLSGKDTPAGAQVRTALEHEPQARRRLRRALDLARWWPPITDADAAVAAGQGGQP